MISIIRLLLCVQITASPAVYAAGHASKRASSKSSSFKPSEQGTSTTASGEDPMDIALKKNITTQRAETKSLLDQEFAKILAIKADKTISDSEKKTAIQKVRETYSARTKAVVLKRRGERQQIHMQYGR